VFRERSHRSWRPCAGARQEILVGGMFPDELGDERADRDDPKATPTGVVERTGREACSESPAAERGPDLRMEEGDHRVAQAVGRDAGIFAVDGDDELPFRRAVAHLDEGFGGHAWRSSSVIDVSLCVSTERPPRARWAYRIARRGTGRGAPARTKVSIPCPRHGQVDGHEGSSVTRLVTIFSAGNPLKKNAVKFKGKRS
jgi:hypothetical protein